MALVNDFPDLCAVIKLMEPKTTSDIAEVGMEFIWARTLVAVTLSLFQY